MCLQSHALRPPSRFLKMGINLFHDHHHHHHHSQTILACLTGNPTQPNVQANFDVTTPDSKSTSTRHILKGHECYPNAHRKNSHRIPATRLPRTLPPNCKNLKIPCSGGGKNSCLSIQKMQKHEKFRPEVYFIIVLHVGYSRHHVRLHTHHTTP